MLKINRLYLLIISVLVFVFLNSVYGFGIRWLDNYRAIISCDEIDFKNSEHRQLRAILDEIIKANHLESRNYTLVIIPLDDKGDKFQPLAEIHLGRKICFSEEFLKLMKTKQGKAFVLAHEISHSELGDLYDFLNILYGSRKDRKSSFHVQAYSHAKELQADKLAIAYLYKTYDPLVEDDVLEMFKVAALIENLYLTKIASDKEREEYEIDKKYNSSHPEDKIRCQAIQDAMNAFKR